MSRRRSSRGFTLLEVMVATVILATALSAIFSSQAGMIAATNHAKRLSIATSLARCRMTEVEDRLRTDGFPLADEDETGLCCEDEEEPYESFECHTLVESVELPSVESIQGAATDLLSQTDAIPTEGPAAEAGGDATQSEAMVGGEIAALYPLVQQVIQASIRRVTVEVVWKLGEEEEKIQAVQYVTMPTEAQQAAQGAEMLGTEGPPEEGATGTPGEPGANPPSPQGGAKGGIMGGIQP